jgi:hypothetical protein
MLVVLCNMPLFLSQLYFNINYSDYEYVRNFTVFVLPYCEFLGIILCGITSARKFDYIKSFLPLTIFFLICKFTNEVNPIPVFIILTALMFNYVSYQG